MITCHLQRACSFRYIDGRVWPKEDELEVRLMMDLIHHVTGTRVALCSCPSSALLGSIDGSVISCVCPAGRHNCCTALATWEAEIVWNFKDVTARSMHAK